MFWIFALVPVLAACSTTTPIASSTPTQIKTLLPYRSNTPSSTPVFTQNVTPQDIPTPTPTPQIYRVKKDELGSSIALRYGITLQMMQSSNPGVDLNFLKEGQELIIPPTARKPVVEQGSPTPALLTVKDIECFPAAGGAGACIGTIFNNQPDAVMYILGEFMVSGNGQIWQKPFTSLLDTLPGGRSIPVYAWFDPPFPYPYQVNITIQSALQQAPEMQKSSNLEIVDQVVNIDPNGLAAKITGNIAVKDASSKTITVVAAGYSNDKPAGIRRFEITPGSTGDLSIPFTIWLYSIGPQMDRVELFAETE